MPENVLTMEVVEPADVNPQDRAQLERFKRNSDWLQSHWADLLPQARGKHLAVAGQEAFIADTPEEAWALARAAHPEDDGVLSQYVFPNTWPRIYAIAGEWQVAAGLAPVIESATDSEHPDLVDGRSSGSGSPSDSIPQPIDPQMARGILCRRYDSRRRASSASFIDRRPT